ncbi:phosphonate ABC transporter ATP-binding protein [Haloplasma contractile]|uniref:Phosphonates import ATP-binding protein PhnC n=1 Tax=Haloplasma contractile SSD-17B TaxID=1033810 RepID=F7Q0D4_9MOLU|nr:phosphonate ABC transporter ATP-binding protein [Haloplasma contractile]ERJ12720.1 Phosphonates import ATP-binding protein PhnC [Haloplasma contractile SSD-17B]
MIKLKNVSVRYKKGEVHAINNLSLSFEKGEFVCVLGKSGAGKSTFIRCINGIQKPTTGEVVINNTSLLNLKEKELRVVRSNIGMIFQQNYLIPRLTVFQNVITGTFGKRKAWKNLLGVFTDEEKERSNRALRAVELENLTERRVEQLSGGQIQRVGIARALVQKPYVILGDEPVASLDISTSIKIFKLLEKIHKEKQIVTIINVHDVQLAKRFATRIVALKNGEVIFDGAPGELTRDVMNQIYDSEWD